MTEHVISDSAIPEPLRAAIRQRRNLALCLQHTISRGIGPEAFQLAEKLADLNRSLRQREWIPRVAGFDPIALGM